MSLTNIEEKYRCYIMEVPQGGVINREKGAVNKVGSYIISVNKKIFSMNSFDSNQKLRQYAELFEHSSIESVIADLKWLQDRLEKPAE